MQLTDALRLRPGMSVAFTGAGGKSSALKTLAAEAAGRFPIVLTTTTRLAPEQRALAQAHFELATADDVLRLPLGGVPSMVVTSGEDVGQGKLIGLEAGLMAALAGRTQQAGAVLAIEADGARGRWLKAPAEHEPVVPPWVDVVVPIAGLKAIGEPLDEGVAHRAERLAALLNMRPGERLTPAHLAALVSSTAGGLKGAPESAEIRVLLAGPRMERVEDEIARAVLEASRVRAVVAGDLEAGEGVERVDGRVAGIVLAGGAGARFGGPKQLAAWRGRPLLGYVLEAAVEARLSPIVVVVGAQADAVRQAIEDPHLRVVVNPDWESGQSTSVRAGLAEVEAEVEAAVFLLADMPRVSARTIQRVVEQHRTTLSPIVAPVGGGRRGNPVLFDRAVFSELHTLQGDEGGRSLLERWRWTAVEADPSEFVEVDVPDDLAGLERGP